MLRYGVSSRLEVSSIAVVIVFLVLIAFSIYRYSIFRDSPDSSLNS